tara:strand:- start:12434 stop:13399 length:966 start_codon:yes stop_codon:yes gene_type:complete
MKAFEIITSILTLAHSVISSPLSLNSTMMTKYNEFNDKYNHEFSYDRFENFKKNTKYIEEFNQQNNSYKLEVNGFADMNDFNFNVSLPHPKNEYYEFEDKIPPESIDWRKENVVTNVKDQGHCGGCWAFSTTGSVEGVVAIKTGNLFNLSEQQLIDCSDQEGNHGCGGGIMDYGFQYIIDNNGICSEEDYPYQGIDGVCQDCEPIIQIKRYGNIFPNNEKILKLGVAQQPVSIAIQANLSSFRFYSEGVYSDPNCGTLLDHGVLLVGYGNDEETGLDYWLVKNSWGPSWGENGYMRMLRNATGVHEPGMCGIAMQPCIPLL